MLDRKEKEISFLICYAGLSLELLKCIRQGKLVLPIDFLKKIIGISRLNLKDFTFSDEYAFVMDSTDSFKLLKIAEKAVSDNFQIQESHSIEILKEMLVTLQAKSRDKGMVLRFFKALFQLTNDTALILHPVGVF